MVLRRKWQRSMGLRQISYSRKIKLKIAAPIINLFYTPGTNGEFPVLQFQDHTQAEIMRAKRQTYKNKCSPPQIKIWS